MASTSREEYILSDEDIGTSGDESSAESDINLDVEEDIAAANLPTWAPHTAGLRQIPFTGNEGFLVPIPDENEPAKFFTLLMDNVFLDFIVRETNHYALRFFCGNTTMPQSRIHRWKDLTVDELKVFLALLFHTGHIQLSRLEDYWRTDDMYNLSFFRKYMSRDRFMLIFRCLHFSSPGEEETGDRLAKIRNVTDHFNNKMRQTYYPSRELTIDESMVLWRGRLIFRQYIKNKRHKYGIKFYCLNEPQGLTMNMKIYAGKNDHTSGKGHASKVVMHMMNPYLGKGHSLYMDNFYNGFPLATKLLSLQTYVTGTLRTDRKYLPNEVKSAKLKKGETIHRYAEEVLVAKWRDKRNVLYMSTEFENTMGISKNKRGELREKPLPIIKYNAHMKGVDRSDQMLSYYPCERKTVRWYKKVFVHVLQVAMVNAWSLYKLAYVDKKITLYDYRHIVIKSLLPAAIESPASISTKKRPNHILSKVPFDQAGKRRKKRCRVCSKEGKRSDVVFFCPACPDEPGLCPVRCFDKFHDSM